jgi:hypothetical protein
MSRTQQEERVRILSEGAAAVRAARATRAPSAALLPAFRTREDGVVVNHKGEVIFTPPQLPPLGKKQEKKP